MRLLLQSAMIFFGTLMAAGLVALGEPGATHSARSAATEKPRLQALNLLVESAHPWVESATAQRGR